MVWPGVRSVFVVDPYIARLFVYISSVRGIFCRRPLHSSVRCLNLACEQPKIYLLPRAYVVVPKKRKNDQPWHSYHFTNILVAFFMRCACFRGAFEAVVVVNFSHVSRQLYTPSRWYAGHRASNRPETAVALLVKHTRGRCDIHLSGTFANVTQVPTSVLPCLITAYKYEYQRIAFSSRVRYFNHTYT